MSLPIKSDAIEVVSGGAANPRLVSGTADPTAGFAGAEGSIYLRYVGSAGKAYIKSGPLNTDWGQIFTGGGGTGTLDQSYDFGGAGGGRIITADSGAVQIDTTTVGTQAALTINRSPASASAAVGIEVVLSGNNNVSAAGVSVADSGSGSSIKVTKSGSGSAYFANLNHVGAKALEVVVTAAPTSVSPVSIVANTTGTTADLLSISKIPGAATAGNALSVSMGANTSGAGLYVSHAGTGPAIAVAAGFVGVGTTTPGYQLDLRSTAPTTSLHIRSGAATDTGGYIISAQDNQLLLSGGMSFDGTDWRAKATTASYMGAQNGGLEWGANSGLTPGNTFTPMYRMILHPAGGLELANSDSATVAPVNAGKFRYLTSTQKMQVSVNGGAYTDLATGAGAGMSIGGAITSATAGSVLFADGSGNLGQDNATFQWKTATKNLLVGASAVTQNFTTFPLTVSTNSVDIVSYMWNTNVNGYSAIGFLDNALTYRAIFGYGNSGVVNGFTSRAFVDCNLCDFAIIDGTTGGAQHLFGPTDGGTFYQQKNGSSAAVSDGNTGRIRYNTTGQKFQVSANGAAYVDIAVGSAMAIGGSITSATAGSVLFAGVGGILQQDNAHFFWDDTNNSLRIGTDAVADAYTNPSLVVSHSSTDAVAYFYNSNASGYSAIKFLDDGANAKVLFGYANGSVGETVIQDKAFMYLLNTDLVLIDVTQEAQHTFGVINAFVHHQMKNGSSAPVSDANTGRIRYNTTGQKFQVSANGAAYVDLAVGAMSIGGSVVSGTTGSVLFIGAGPVLAQDNAAYFWDATEKRLLVTQSATDPLDGKGTITLRNTNAGGNASVYYNDASGGFTGTTGYDNTAAAVRVYTHTTIPFDVFTAAGGFQWRYTIDGALRFPSGGSAAVSASNTGTVRYNTTGQKFQVSANGGAYVDLATSAGPSVERLSADGAANPAIDRTFVSGSGTDLTLANGASDGFIKSFVVTGGTGTITPTNLADGDVLTWTASPANVSFIWDATAVTWHVHGSPYNMVTT